MENKTSITDKSKALNIADVMCSTWQPTMVLRWLEGRNYIAQLDQFERTLQQKWKSDTGAEEWRDIDVYS